MNSSKFFGCIFLLASGLLYTFERGVASLAFKIHLAGFLISNTGTKYPSEQKVGFFDNIFVCLFLIVGFVFLAYGFYKKKSR